MWQQKTKGHQSSLGCLPGSIARRIDEGGEKVTPDGMGPISTDGKAGSGADGE